MKLFDIRGRIGSAIGAVIGACFLFACGAFLAFLISPQQALEWWQIDRMPELDAAAYNVTADGADVVVTGYLQDNAALTE